MNNSKFNEAILVNVKFASSEVRFSKPGYNIIDDNVTLRSADFSSAKLVDVEFTDVDLTNANFTNTDLESVKFDNAILNKVDFSSSYNMRCEQIDNAKESTNVLLPRYLKGCSTKTTNSQSKKRVLKAKKKSKKKSR